MKKLLLAGACAASIVLGVSNAQAADLDDPVPGDIWYVSLFGGASFLDEFGINYSYTSGGGGRSENRTDPGFIVGLAVGAEIIPNLRAELEVSYFENDVNRQNFPSGPVTFSATGHVNSVNVLANAWYDFDMGNGLTPYVGGGAGVGFVDARSRRPNPFDEFDGSDVGFAFQAGGGLKFAVSEMIDADVGYRYRGVLDVTFPSEFAGQVNGSTDIFGHFVQAGITIKLDGM
jgi:opacity protein-like surface antigen